MEEHCECGHTHENNSEDEMEEIEVCANCDKPLDECTCPCEVCGKPAEECACPCEVCGKVECECEPVDIQDIAEHTDDKVDALIELLIKKGIISEDEYRKAYEDLFEKDSEDKTEHPGEPIAN